MDSSIEPSVNRYFEGFRCLKDQQHHYPPSHDVGDRGVGCIQCYASGAPASVRMDYDSMENMRARSDGRGLTRFRQLLAYGDFPSLGEGDTPLVPLPSSLAEHFGFTEGWLKLENANSASHSYKDRCMPLAVAAACRAGAEVVTAASSGNAGVSLAAYAAAAGKRCEIVTTDNISEIWANSITAYGAQLAIVPTAKDRWHYIKQMKEKEGWYSVTNCEDPPVGSNPFGVEGYETIAFEIIEDLYGKVPDFVLVPTARADGLWGIWHGFVRAHQAGIISHLPRMVAVEPVPRLEKVLSDPSSYTQHFSGNPHGMSSIGGDTVTYQGYAALRDSLGQAVTVSNEQALAGRQMLASLGYCVELSSAAALAALEFLHPLGMLRRGTAVVVITSAGYKDVPRRPDLRRSVTVI